jgi:hypothetical protein
MANAESYLGTLEGIGEFYAESKGFEELFGSDEQLTDE